jgi:hypothetical protein
MQLATMAKRKARDPGDVPLAEDVERIVKCSKALLNAISAWEASYKKEVKAARGPAAFGHAREKSSELDMERFKVWRCCRDSYAKPMLHFIKAHANSCSWALALPIG